jgi:hypothetical protein
MVHSPFTDSPDGHFVSDTYACMSLIKGLGKADCTRLIMAPIRYEDLARDPYIFTFEFAGEYGRTQVRVCG